MDKTEGTVYVLEIFQVKTSKLDLKDLEKKHFQL